MMTRALPFCLFYFLGYLVVPFHLISPLELETNIIIMTKENISTIIYYQKKDLDFKLICTIGK